MRFAANGCFFIAIGHRDRDRRPNPPAIAMGVQRWDRDRDGTAFVVTTPVIAIVIDV
jgi:hypothetical protein